MDAPSTSSPPGRTTGATFPSCATTWTSRSGSALANTTTTSRSSTGWCAVLTRRSGAADHRRPAARLTSTPSPGAYSGGMSSPAGDQPEVLAEYERHLVSERDLAPHTVRAYVADVGGLLEHAERMGGRGVIDLDLRTLRSWLAHQQVTGHSRTTLARRATAVRVFTAWLTRTGRIPSDVGATLRSPKARQTLPPVLRQDEAAELIAAAAR